MVHINSTPDAPTPCNARNTMLIEVQLGMTSTRRRRRRRRRTENNTHS
jgi:hypothetical protein